MAAADFPAFLAMNAETGQRDGFGVHEAAYYEAAFELFPPEQARWLIAEADGQPLAAIVASPRPEKLVHVGRQQQPGAAADAQPRLAVGRPDLGHRAGLPHLRPVGRPRRGRHGPGTLER